MPKVKSKPELDLEPEPEPSCTEHLKFGLDARRNSCKAEQGREEEGPPPGISKAYWKLQQEKYLRPPSPSKFYRSNFKATEIPSPEKPKFRGKRPNYEPYNALNLFLNWSEIPKERITEGIRRQMVHRWGQIYDEFLENMSRRWNASVRKTEDTAVPPKNRVNYGCERVRELASMAPYAVETIVRRFATGAPNKDLFWLKRTEAMDCWERVLDSHKKIKPCCVATQDIGEARRMLNKPEIKALNKVPLVLKSREKRAQEVHAALVAEKVAMQAQLEQELMQMLDSKMSLSLDTKGSVSFFSPPESLISEAGGEGRKSVRRRKSRRRKTKRSQLFIEEEEEDEDEAEDDAPTLDQFIHDEVEKVGHSHTHFSVNPPESYADLKGQHKEDVPSYNYTADDFRNMPPFCPPLPPPERRMPWHLDPVLPRDGVDRRPEFFFDRSLRLDQIIPKTKDTYGVLRKKQRYARTVEMREKMVEGFLKRSKLPPERIAASMAEPDPNSKEGKRAYIRQQLEDL